MPTIEIKDQATAETAARNLNSGIEPPAPKEGEPKAPRRKSTAERLFPDFTTDDGAIINRPVRSKGEKVESPQPASATPPAPTHPATQTTPAPTVPVYLSNEEMTGKMVKIKVNGVESDVPAESLLKNYQLERHLNERLMNLAREKADLEREKTEWSIQNAPSRISSVQNEPPKAAKEPPPVKSAEVEAMESRLLAMQQRFDALQASMLPAIRESGIKRVEEMAKKELGTEDFRTYFERIRDMAVQEIQKPENAGNPQALQFFDSDAYYFNTYKSLKLRDMLNAASPANVSSASAPPNAPVLQTQQGAPVVLTNSGRAVSVPIIEPSGGVSSKSPPSENYRQEAQAMFDRARQEGTTEAWLDYFKIKTGGS